VERVTQSFSVSEKVKDEVEVEKVKRKAKKNV